MSNAPLDLSVAVDLARHPEMESELEFISAVLNENEVEMRVFAQAAGYAERALSREPDNAMLVFILATLYLKAEKLGLAEVLFKHSLNLQWTASTALNLSFLLQSTGRTMYAREHLLRILAADPHDQRALANMSGACINMHTPDEAIKYADQLLAIDPENSDGLWNKSLAFLEKGEWAEGWKLYRHGATLSQGNQTQRKRRFEDIPYWDGSEGAVVVYGEQGVGDELMGYGMINEMIERVNGKMVLETHPRLVTIARAAFGTRIPVYGTRKVSEADLAWPQHFDFTHRIPLLGLAEYFRPDADSWQNQHAAYLPCMPFDALPNAAAARLDTLLAGAKVSIGLSWVGGSALTKGAERSMTLGYLVENFCLKFDQSQVNWVSLQYDPAETPGAAAEEVARVNDKYGIDIRHDQDIVNDLTLCYGWLIQEVDSIVSVCTSLVHAAGAFCKDGPTTHVLAPYEIAWRYGLEGAHMPIYGQHILMHRQQRDGDWLPVLERLRLDLVADQELFKCL